MASARIAAPARRGIAGIPANIQQRTSMRRFWPSVHPSCCSPWMKAAREVLNHRLPGRVSHHTSVLTPQQFRQPRDIDGDPL
jgi:hypothetical protein